MERSVKASLDRFEGDIAVIYSDDGTKFDVSRGLVEGLHPGDRLLLKIIRGDVIRVEIDQKATEDARERIRRKYKSIQDGEHLG